MSAKDKKWKRNKRRREELVKEGFTDQQARAIILAEGMQKNARDIHEMMERNAIEDRWFPKQPKKPHSVHAILAGGFETRRRNH